MDFVDQLRRQLNFLVTSCAAYEAGRLEEAARIAVAARVLFHDTSSSHSLVRHHLNASPIKMRSTTGYLPSSDKMHFLGFIGLAPGDGSFRPYLDNVARDEQVALNDWWDVEPILEIKKGLVITRKEVVLDAAHKDGGAHVDPDKPARFQRLEQGLGLEVKVILTSGEQKMVSLKYANLAILRQIGHEILTSKDLRDIADRSA